MRDNVFSPSFGNRPRQLVGRTGVLESLEAGLAAEPGSKQRAVVLLGQRGSGKTVLLWEFADRARERGFVVASPTVVSETMLDRIVEKIQDDGERCSKGKRQIVGGSIGAFGFSAGLQFSDGVESAKSFGYKLLKLADRLNRQGRGLLLLVDELQANSPQLKQLIIAYQELVGERMDAALVLAGLPGAASSVLNDHVLTFLNRAQKLTLEPLATGDVDAFFSQAFETAGVSVPADLRREAARATQGHPYLMQLLGHAVVSFAVDGKAVDDRVLGDALHAAKLTFEEDVCETTLAALSDRDVCFLEAMVGEGAHGGASKMSDVAERMGVSPDYAQKYRKRLISGGVIESRHRGYVSFAVPYLSDYLARR